MRRLDFDFVKNKIESFDCELLSTEYKNSDEDLKIKFACGHIGYRSYTAFIKKNKVCKDCSFKNAGKQHRRNIDDIKQKIASLGCEWVGGEYEGRDSKLTIKFLCGHRDVRTYDSFLISKKLCEDCTRKQRGRKRRNKIDSVRKFIESRDCEWVDGIYENQTSPLKIKFSCGHVDTRNYVKFKELANVCPTCSGKKQYTLEEVRKIFEDNEFVLLENEYINCKKKMAFKDGEGYKYGLTFDQFLHNYLERGSGLSKFDKQNPYTIENIKNYLKINAPYLYLQPDQKWKRNSSKLEFVDDFGYKYYTSFWCLQSTIEGKNSPIIVGADNKYSLENIERWIELNKPPFHLVKEQKFISAKNKLEYKCHKCHPNEIPFEANWFHILRGGGCGLCVGSQIGNYNNLSYIRPDIAKEWDYVTNYPVIPEKVAPHSISKYCWICSDCGKSYLASVSKRTGNDPRGCPFCSESNMEKRIRKFLEEKNVKIERQKKFHDCRDLLPLPFDFYLPEYHLACEAQGIQHFLPVEHFGGEENFKDRKKKDKIKEDYCRNNGIDLLCISYKEYNQIESILTQELNLN